MSAATSLADLRRKGEAAIASKFSGSGVPVPMGYAAMIPAGAGAYNWIATWGAGPCIAVLLVGSKGVGLAHVIAMTEEEAEQRKPFLRKLAGYALGTIPNPTTVVMSSGTTPQGSVFFTTLKAPFDAALKGAPVKVSDSTELAYILKSNSVEEKVPLSAIRGKIAKGVPYWNIKSEDFFSQPTWPSESQ